MLTAKNPQFENSIQLTIISGVLSFRLSTNEGVIIQIETHKSKYGDFGIP